MLWLRHYWTIKLPPLPLSTTFGSVLRLWNYVQVVGGCKKTAGKATYSLNDVLSF